MYFYSIYGLMVASEFPLPELLAIEDVYSPDVVIQNGEIPNPFPHQSYFCALEDRFIIAVEDVARFAVHDGREIVVDQEAGAHDDTLRLYLLGSAFGALLHQRGFLPLHASCVAAPDRTMLFCGHSGAGKSTLAAALCRNSGYQFLADDISVLRLENETPMIYPGYPQLKLWHNSVEKLEMNAQDFRRVRPAVEKFAVPLRDQFTDQQRPFHVIYLLTPSDVPTITLTPLKGIEKLLAIKKDIYRAEFLDVIDPKNSYFQTAASLLNTVRVVRVVRPIEGFHLDALVEAIQRDAQLIELL